MTISIASGAAAYADAARKLAGTSATADPVKGSGTGFADLLKDAVQGAINTERTGEATSLQAATGKADINAVVSAVTNAEMTLQTVVAVRDKIVSAYQQILQMQV